MEEKKIDLSMTPVKKEKKYGEIKTIDLGSFFHGKKKERARPAVQKA